MKPHEKAAIVADCASRIDGWSTKHLPHDTALAVQKELVRLSGWLQARAQAIHAGTVIGVYDDPRDRDSSCSSKEQQS